MHAFGATAPLKVILFEEARKLFVDPPQGKAYCLVEINPRRKDVVCLCLATSL